jgi:PTS system nitrogen regulatory IIA component
MYLNLIQIAESFGVSEKVVQGWILNENLPCTSDRGRLLFDRAQVATWAAGRGLAAHVGFLAPEAPGAGGGWRLEDLLRRGGIWRGVTNGAVPEIYQQLVSRLPGIGEPVSRLLVQRIGAKDGVTAAPVGGGLALPHPSARISLGRGCGLVALLLLSEPLTMAGPPVDDIPITRLAFFIAPSPRAHLDLLGRLSRALLRGPLREAVLRGDPDEAILAVAAEDDALAEAGSREAGA